MKKLTVVFLLGCILCGGSVILISFAGQNCKNFTNVYGTGDSSIVSGVMVPMLFAGVFIGFILALIISLNWKWILERSKS